MFCHMLAVYVLGCLLQILPQIPSVHGAVIPQSAEITATGSTLGASPVYCNDLEGFVGKGIVRADCEAAIREFRSTTVRPRGNQEYEFLSREVHPVSHLPTVVTPTRFSHGTCVFIVQMMDVFNWAPLPGGQPRTYPRNDIATYPDILDVALALSSQCVEERSNPQAGWSLTGFQNSIGVLLVRRGCDVDKVLRSDAPMTTSINNGTSPINLIKPSGLSDMVKVFDNQ